MILFYFIFSINKELAIHIHKVYFIISHARRSRRHISNLSAGLFHRECVSTCNKLCNDILTRWLFEPSLHFTLSCDCMHIRRKYRDFLYLAPLNCDTHAPLHSPRQAVGKIINNSIFIVCISYSSYINNHYYTGKWESKFILFIERCRRQTWAPNVHNNNHFHQQTSDHWDIFLIKVAIITEDYSEHHEHSTKIPQWWCSLVGKRQ